MSIISVQNISKKYLIRHERAPYATLRDRLAHPIKDIRNKVIYKPEEYWALNNVSFEVEQGDVMGIIGPNGSGKSTLLKVLSQITPPTRGKAILRGRVASLLEVGTGFHGELSGRENIFMSGVILGMTKNEIHKKFDEIVNFAGVEKFLDTPIKYYSSGMNVRLGFSVAAHLDSDILIVDEVLAVGDAEFQKKCLTKMDNIAKNHGRTILFVSHDMNAIKNICNKGLCLNSGAIKIEAEINKVVEYYLTGDNLKAEKDKSVKDIVRTDNVSLLGKIIEFNFYNNDRLNPAQVDSTRKINIQLTIEAKDSFSTGVFIWLKSNSYETILNFDSLLINKKEFDLKRGNNIINLEIEPTFLTSGKYYIDCALYSTRLGWIDILGSVYNFSVSMLDPYLTGNNIDQDKAKYFVHHKWI